MVRPLSPAVAAPSRARDSASRALSDIWSMLQVISSIAPAMVEAASLWLDDESETFRAASAACRATSEMAVALSRTSRSEPPILSSRALKARAVCPASSCRWIFTRAVKSLLPSMRTIARRMPSREPTMLRITRKDISASQEGHQRQDDEGHGEDRADDADGRELRRFSGFALFARP